MYCKIENAKYCGTPTHFVSHTWESDILGLLHAVIEHGENLVQSGNQPPIYYIDFVSIDQHLIDIIDESSPENLALEDADLPFNTLCKEFTKQITSCKEVLVVVSPFDTPLCVKSAWCQFEVAVAMTHDIPITVVIPKDQKSVLRDRILEGDGDELLRKVMGAIDSSKSTATRSADAENIRCFIENELVDGYGAIDEMYREMIRHWILSNLDSVFESMQPGRHAAEFAKNCSLLLADAKYQDKAAVFHRRGLEVAPRD